MCFSERGHVFFLSLQVLTWAKQHQQRLEAALSELVANAELLEELLAWIQWAETTLIQRDQEPIPQNIDRVKALITEHQVFCFSVFCVLWTIFPSLLYLPLQT